MHGPHERVLLARLVLGGCGLWLWLWLARLLLRELLEEEGVEEVAAVALVLGQGALDVPVVAPTKMDGSGMSSLFYFFISTFFSRCELLLLQCHELKSLSNPS
jgi:hypothetical protein